MNNMQNKLAFTRKFKYGSMALALSVLVIAVTVIVNVVFSSFAYSNNWYIDLTENKVYGLTDGGRAILDEIDSNIKIHFCTPYDNLESDPYTKMVFELVKEMSAEYDNITYDYIDVVKNPTAVTKFKSSANTNISAMNVIVENMDGTQFRVFTFQNFFTVDNQTGKPWAFNGERKLVTAISQITQIETPIAYFTHTHGEKLSEAMLELFVDAGYEILPIDLTKEEIDSRARVVVISSPTFDFEGISADTAGRKSEIEKLDDFLDSYGNLMVFADPGARELPELEEFLVEWGISFDDSQLRDPSNSIDTTHSAIVGQYSLEQNLGGGLVEELISTGTPPKTIVRDARPINLLWETKNGRTTSTAIYSSDKAQKYVNGEAVETGRYSLVAMSRETRYIDNTPYHAFVFAVGSSNFIADQYLTPTYGNADIIYTMMRAMGKTQVPIDLDFKPFEETALDITTKEAEKWTWVLVTVVPIIVFACGIVVWNRRKNA